MQHFLVAAGFIFGAIIGSFLNVCIYRIPRGISLIRPARSFCPDCQASIPWRHNIPIFSWFLLRGRCAHCGAPISQRYVIVEMLTAILFATAAWLVPIPTWFSVCVILSILVVTTFVDLEFFIIPDVLSKGGIVAGLLLSYLTPELHQTSSPLVSIALSLSGAFAGALILFAISELGKLAFGRYEVKLQTPTRFILEVLPPDDWQIVIENEPFIWSEHFSRRSDRIMVRAIEVEINGIAYRNIDLTFLHDRLVTVSETIPLEKITSLTGITASAQFPREAMGLGDVKLLAAIGTFVGWQGILFTIAAASFLGAAFGLATIALGKRERSAKIPFGPFLAMGTVIWLFWGETLLSLYQGAVVRM